MIKFYKKFNTHAIKLHLHINYNNKSCKNTDKLLPYFFVMFVNKY